MEITRSHFSLESSFAQPLFSWFVPLTKMSLEYQSWNIYRKYGIGIMCRITNTQQKGETQVIFRMSQYEPVLANTCVRCWSPWPRARQAYRDGG